MKRNLKNVTLALCVVALVPLVYVSIQIDRPSRDSNTILTYVI